MVFFLFNKLSSLYLTNSVLRASCYNMRFEPRTNFFLAIIEINQFDKIQNIHFRVTVATQK